MEGGGGGGQITQGSIEIVSIDATHVEYELTGVNPPEANWSVSVDGSHIAERCQ